ncbi:MAG: hypothetical protein HY722_10230 [Planctomycetes bacterium]|nr:hypothetical protein [Planctomycetota bacterium]
MYDVVGLPAPSVEIDETRRLTGIEDENGDPIGDRERNKGIASAAIKLPGWHRILIFDKTKLFRTTEQVQTQAGTRSADASYLVVSADFDFYWVHDTVEGRRATPTRSLNQRKVLRIEQAVEPLPRFADTPQATDFDAHYHTMSEFTTDLGLFAPKKAHGGPLRMVELSAFALGLIDTDVRDTLEASNRLITTDHNAFLTDPHDIPEVGPYRDPVTGQVRPPREEYEVLKEFFGPLSAGQEVTLAADEFGRQPIGTVGPVTAEIVIPFLLSLGRHALAYGHPVAFPGPWHGGKAGLSRQGIDSLHDPVARGIAGRALDALTSATGSRELVLAEPNNLGVGRVIRELRDGTGPEGARAGNGVLFAAHPLAAPFFVWEDEKFAEAARFDRFQNDENGVRDDGFVFKGLQRWNIQSLNTRDSLYGYQLRRLNPFEPTGKIVDRSRRLAGAVVPELEVVYRPGWEPEADPYEELRNGLGRWEDLLRQGLDYRFVGQENRRFLRKLYAIAGTDAHGDFNYTTDVLASHLSEPRILFAPIGVTSAVNDNAFGKLRTHLFGRDRAEMDHGRAVLTNGPLADFFFDAELRFDDAGFHWFDTRADPRSAQDRDGQMGGTGRFDGGRTLLWEPEGRPVVRYRWTNSADFGGDIEDIALFGAFEGESGGPTAFRGLTTPLENDLGAFDLVGFRRPVPPGQPPKPVTRAAIYLGAFTEAPAGGRFINGQFFCLTNPIWTSPTVLDPRLAPPGLGDTPPAVNAFSNLVCPRGTLSLLVSFSHSMDVTQDFRARGKQLNAGGSTLPSPQTFAMDLVSTLGDASGRSFLFQNVSEVVFPADPLRRYPPGRDAITLVMYLEHPVDIHGNVLNPVAKTLMIDLPPYRVH